MGKFRSSWDRPPAFNHALTRLNEAVKELNGVPPHAVRVRRVLQLEVDRAYRNALDEASDGQLQALVIKTAGKDGDSEQD